MVRERTILEGTYALIRIENIKKWSYIIQSVTILSLAVVLMVMGGSSLRPFYIPVSSFLYFVIIMLLVLNIESIGFRMIEIFYNPSESRKYLMIKNSLRRAIIIGAVSAVLVVFLILPQVNQALSNALSYTKELSEKNSAIYVSSQDHFGMVEVSSITIRSSYHMNVYILSAGDYKLYKAGDKSVFSRRLNFNTDPYSGIVFSPQTTGFEEYYIVMESAEPGAIATCKIDRRPLPHLMDKTAIILIGFIITNFAWAGYLMPLKKKYAKLSIYL